MNKKSHILSFGVMTPMWVIGLMSHNPNDTFMIETRNHCDKEGHTFYRETIEAIHDEHFVVDLHLCTRDGYFWFDLNGELVDGYLVSLDIMLALERQTHVAETMITEAEIIGGF